MKIRSISEWRKVAGFTLCDVPYCTKVYSERINIGPSKYVKLCTTHISEAKEAKMKWKDKCLNEMFK